MTNAIPKQPTKAQVVAFEVLLGEREYQAETHPDNPAPTLTDFANLLIEYTDKLAVDVQVGAENLSPAGGPLKRLREIAAIALHAMEIYGIQPRENHVPASAGITGVLKVVTGPDTTVPAKPAPVAHEARTAPPPVPPVPPPHPAPTEHSAPVAAHHEAVELPHHPASGEHGK